MEKEEREVDIFVREQRVYEDAEEKNIHMKEGGVIDPLAYDALTQEYGKLLKQMRLVTKISDRATDNLCTSKLALLDKMHFDMLTGIYNRRYLEETIKRNIRSLLRTEGSISVMMLDVDHFKNYNDTYGHNAGDICLKAVAQAISDSLTRVDDYVARYGGEEFVVVLPNTGEPGARFIANRILENVRDLNIVHEENYVADCVTISIGVMATKVKQHHTGTAYVKCADEALYESKHKGRNRYTWISFEEE